MFAHNVLPGPLSHFVTAPPKGELYRDLVHTLLDALPVGLAQLELL